MASSKPWRDWLYWVIIVAQLSGMLLLDFVAFYPSGLWRAPGSPLHFLVWVRQTYVAASADPYARDPTAFPWFEAMTYVELLSEFPLAVYLAYKLALRKPTDGPTELAALVFASLTAMTSGVVCFDLFHLSHDLVTPAQKNQLLWSAFGPYTVIPAVMAVDMYLRLLPRVRETRKTKSQ